MAVWADARFALRTIRREPAVAALAILSLALGLACAAAAQSLLDAVGFRPLAVHDPDQLVEVRTLEGRDNRAGRTSMLDYEDLRSRAHTFSSLAVHGMKGAGLSGPDAAPEVVMIDVVSPEYFGTLDVAPRAGRLFVAADSAPDAPPTVVISDKLWQRRFARDPGLVARTIDLDGTVCRVIGVLPADFTGMTPMIAPDAWILLSKWTALIPGSAVAESRDNRWLAIVGRLRAPISRIDRIRAFFGTEPPALAGARREVERIAADLHRAYPDTNRDGRATVVSQSSARHPGGMTIAILLWAIVGLVVAVGCANVAGLLLGRAESRRQEMAVRTALGASRGRLIRQLLTEGLVLALAAATLGLALAVGLIHAMPALLPPMGLPLGFTFRLDLRVVLATMTVALATTIVFGLWPALMMSRRQNLAATARTDSTTGSAGRWSMRSALVVGQVAVSMVLVTGGMLCVRSLANTRAIDPGFERQRPLLLVTLAPVAIGYDTPRTKVFFDELVDRMRAAPGIRQVSLARRVPLAMSGGGAVKRVEFPGQPPPADGAPISIKFNAVQPNYFGLMGTRLRTGRAFTDRDTTTAPRVAVINDMMARRYWPGRSPVGERYVVVGTGEVEVVGVVEDGKINQLTEAAEPYMFFPLAQVSSSELTMIVDAGADPSLAAATTRRVIRTIDPKMPTLSMLTLDEHLRAALYGDRLSAIVVGVLGSVGLTLALVGLYGVVAFIVARRTKEIGVRMALGARPQDILREVLGRALVLVLWGVGIGIALGQVAALALTRTFYGISASDPLTFAAAALGLIVVSLAASAAPARRATRVDPVKALRTE